MNHDQLHPSLNLLVSFDRGLLAPDEWPEIDQHIANCRHCCEQLEQLPDDYVLAMLRQPIARGGGDTPPVDPSQPLPPVEMPPELVGHARYRVLGVLGQGGMGTVYKAEHRLMGRLVALKVISNRFLDRPEWLERFRREIKTAAQLDHPNIIHAYDAEEVGGSQVLIMEYAPGENLERYLKRQGPLSVREACDYICQTALGLQHAFERGMVHRDIKPQNLLRAPSGEIRILDFGLARFASETAVPASLTQSGLTVGTPDYIAPEQALDARRADIRADIYSLGCTLYQLLSGKPPFPDGTAIQKVMCHQCQAPPPLRSRRSDVPQELARVVDKMLAKDPDRRYQTPAEVAAALAPWAAPPVIGASASGKVEPPKPTPRFRGGLWAALLLFAVGGICLAWATSPSQTTGADQARAVLVWTRSPAMSAPAVEKVITERIERQVIEAPGIARLESRSVAGHSMIKAYLRPDATPAVLSAVGSLAASALERLPEGTPRPVVVPFEGRWPQPIGVIAIQNPQLDEVRLTELARNQVISRLGAIPGMGPLALQGARDHAVIVHLDRVKLQARSLPPAHVLKILRGHPAFDEPPKVSLGDTEYTVILSSGELEKLSRVPVSSGSPIRLSDVGWLEESASAARERVRLDQKGALSIPVFTQGDASPNDLETAIQELLETLKPGVGDGTELRYLGFPIRRTKQNAGALVEIRLRLPTGSTLAATERLVDDLEQVIVETIADDRRMFLLSHLGVTDSWVSAFSNHSGPCDATLRVRVADAAEDCATRLRELLKHDQRLAAARCSIISSDQSSFEILVFCNDAKAAWTAAEQVRDQLARLRRLTDVEIVERNDAPMLQVELDLNKTADLGMNADDARTQIADALGGLRTSWIDLKSGVTYQPALMNAGDDTQSVSKLLNLPLGAGGQASLFRLGHVAAVHRGIESEEIAHRGLKRVLHVRATVDREFRTAAVADVKKLLDTLTPMAGVHLEVDE